MLQKKNFYLDFQLTWYEDCSKGDPQVQFEDSAVSEDSDLPIHKFKNIFKILIVNISSLHLYYNHNCFVNWEMYVTDGRDWEASQTAISVKSFYSLNRTSACLSVCSLWELDNISIVSSL